MTQSDFKIWVDTHCHLNLDAFDADRSAVIHAAREADVGRILIPGIDLATSIQARNIAEQHDGAFFACGVHPNTNTAVDDALLAELKILARHERCAAIGEIGLDYYWDDSPRELQLANLRAQLDLAEALDKPVILHCRDAFDELYPIAANWSARNPKNRGVFHAFDGSPAEAALVTRANFFVGLGGAVTFKNKPVRREMARLVPLEKVILETDAPYLTPTPHRGKRNLPSYIPLIGAFLAELRDVSIETIRAVTTANAFELFHLTQSY